MLVKRLLLAFIISLFLINYIPTSHALHSRGINKVVNYYSLFIADKTPINILYNPGLRNLPTQDELNIWAVLPNAYNFPQILDEFLVNEGNALIECSSLDSWHCTQIGNEYLQKVREKAYRMVIFDGGHHLPTLGMEPDIIILPVLNDYAIHSYMLDGIKVNIILDIVKEIKAPIIIVKVPRWAMVKQEKSMVKVAEKIINEAKINSCAHEPFSPVSQMKMSKYNRAILAYVDKNYSSDIKFFLNNLEKLGCKEVKIIYLAFDYNWTNYRDALMYAKKVQEYTGLKVKVVNEPIKVSNSF